jgi:beta-lactamase class A
VRPRLLALVAALLLPAARAQPQQAAPLDSARSRIEAITRSIQARWGIYVKCLETGEEIALGADEQMDTMSTIKIPLMVEAYRQSAAGALDLGEKHTLKDEEKQPGTGVLQRWAAGTVLSLADLIDLMIIVSDNTATDILFRRVGGPAAVNRTMDAWGLDRIRATGLAADWFRALRAQGDAAAFHREAKNPFGLATARQMGMLLEKIARRDAVSEKASDAMLRHMRGQLYATRIPRYLPFTPFGARPPHKTGDFLPYIGNDVGILEAPGRRVVVSIFTANHFGLGTLLEEAIGRVTEQAALHFAAR